MPPNDREIAFDRRFRSIIKGVAFIAGLTAPPGKRMGHAGALVGGEDETAASKIQRLEATGVPVARIPSEVPKLLLNGRRRPS